MAAVKRQVEALREALKTKLDAFWENMEELDQIREQRERDLISEFRIMTGQDPIKLTEWIEQGDQVDPLLQCAETWFRRLSGNETANTDDVPW